MPRGSLPGERRGGRKKGAKNKATIERIRLAGLEKARLISSETKPARGKADSIQLVEVAKGRLVATVGDERVERMTMRDIMEFAARHFFKEGMYWEAARVAAAAAPYGHARLSRVIMDANVRRDAHDFSDAELVALTVASAVSGEDGAGEERERPH